MTHLKNICIKINAVLKIKNKIRKKHVFTLSKIFEKLNVWTLLCGKLLFSENILKNKTKKL